MDKLPLVSVLMTSYNREKYIGEAIESVLASTYKNFEMIITDDGSKDKTVSIAKQYEAIDTRIKVYINEKNLGDYNNRNRAASYAKGKYLKYLDSDDIIYPHGLQIMVSAMEQFPEAAYGFSYRQKELTDSPYPWQVNSKEAYKAHFEGGGFFYAGPGSSIIRKDIFDKVGGFSGKRYVGDTELWMKLSQFYACIVFQPFLIWWRIHGEQESITESEHVDGIVFRFKNDCYFLASENCPLGNNAKKRLVLNCHRIIWRKILLRIVTKFKFDLYIRTKPPIHQLFFSFLPINRLSRMFYRQKSTYSPLQ